MADEPVPAALCVLCRKHPVDRAWRPFCSERCKLQDLAKWADGQYHVPVEKPIDADDNDDADNDKVRSAKSEV